MKNFIFLCILLISSTFTPTLKAQATEPFLGQIAFVPYNFVPKNWAECNGQLLSISQNTALFALWERPMVEMALPHLLCRI
jgi:hypothetical protein